MKTYLYAHILPDSGEIIYIGIGTEARAWSLHKRSGPHSKVLNNILSDGYSPADYVVVLAQALTESQARALELVLIRQLKPVFNQQGNGAANAGRGAANKNAVLTDSVVMDMRALYKGGGLSMRAVSRKFNIGATAGRKILTGAAWSHLPT